MEGDLKHSQERGKGLERKFRASSRALRVEPDLSARWTQNTVLHHSLAEQNNVCSDQATANAGRERRFIKRRACQVKAEKISAVTTKSLLGAKGQGEPGFAVAATAQVVLTPEIQHGGECAPVPADERVSSKDLAARAEQALTWWEVTPHLFCKISGGTGSAFSCPNPQVSTGVETSIEFLLPQEK